MFLKRLSSILKSLLKKFDLFPTDQFVRYNKETQYTTATGGLISVAVIISILILFSSKGIQLLDRSVISSTVSTSIEIDPAPIKVVASPEGGFMFSIGMFGLTNPLATYFDISLTQNYYSPVYKLINQTNVPLVQCTPAHYNFNEEVLSMFYRLKIANAFCPPLGYTFQVGGRFTSAVFSQFSITVQKCSSNRTSNCVNDTVMSSIGSFVLTVPIVNTIVNPNDEQYLQTYIEDRNFFRFTNNYGVIVQGEISQLAINTDISIMPYEEVISEIITSVPNLLTSSNAAVQNNVYCSVSFSKSSAVTTFTRSFSKLDNFVSYIGGFVGAALVLFFLLRAYSEKSFLVDVGSQLFRDEGEGCTLTRFSFFDNMAVAVKGALNVLRIPLEWKRGEFLGRAMEETEAQIDVALLLRRVAFVEEAVSVLFAPHQLHALHLRPKRLLREAQQQRNKYHFMQVMQSLAEGQAFQQKVNDSTDSKSHANVKQQFEEMKLDIRRILRESQGKDAINKRIMQKIAPEMLERFGVHSIGNSQIIELKQNNSQHISSSFSHHKLNLEHGSKDSIFIEHEAEQKSIEKQDFVFQYNQN